MLINRRFAPRHDCSWRRVLNLGELFFFFFSQIHQFGREVDQHPEFRKEVNSNRGGNCKGFGIFC